jgi:hypothetical protein
MILHVIEAAYISDYKIQVHFDNGETRIVDLENFLMNEKRIVFHPHKDKNFFKDFFLDMGAICWKNETDLAPEFLYQIGKAVSKEKIIAERN